MTARVEAKLLLRNIIQEGNVPIIKDSIPLFADEQSTSPVTSDVN